MPPPSASLNKYWHVRSPAHCSVATPARRGDHRVGMLRMPAWAGATCLAREQRNRASCSGLKSRWLCATTIQPRSAGQLGLSRREQRALVRV
jgi:hypothetical protein